MCGIAGMIGTGWTIQQFKLLFDAIEHRGPDGSGIYTSDALKLGMNRLRLRGADTRLPLRDKNVIAAFNGQIYGVYNTTGSYCDLIGGIEDELSAVRLNSLEIDGMYACSIVTLDDEELFLITDPQFIKPLFYRRGEQGIAFCSEFAALLPLSAQNSINHEALAELFAYGWYLSDSSYVSQISTLCKHDLFVHGDTVCPQPKTEVSPPLVTGDRETEIRRALRESVRRCMQGTGPFGLAISGGLDSSILAWELNAAGVEGLITLSIRMGDWDGVASLDELGLPPGGAWETWEHHTVTFRNEHEFLSAFATSTVRFGQPTTMSSLSLYWLLAQTAAETGVRVLLTGEGVDEFFCGYGSYSKVCRLGQLLDYYQHPQREKLVRILFGAEAFESVKQRFMNCYINCTDLRQIECELRLVRLLIRTDVCLMSYSIEGRVPFLHNQIPDLALAIPWEELTESMGKAVLRSAYSTELKQISSTPKRRFKASDEILKRSLTNPNVYNRISDATSSIFGVDETQHCLATLTTDSGFDPDICCLLMSLTFLIEQGSIK